MQGGGLCRHYVDIIRLCRRDKPQVVENYSYLFNLISNIYKSWLNPLKPEFTIVISIPYKPRIAAAILDF